MAKWKMEHDHSNMAKRKSIEHNKLRLELDRHFKDIAKNMDYKSMVECAENFLKKGTNCLFVNTSNMAALVRHIRRNEASFTRSI